MVDNNFNYRQIISEEWPFAQRLMAWINRNLKGPMVDLGAGPGMYVEAARMYGWEAKGYDITDNQLRPDLVEKASLFDINDIANTVLCIEVAEHIDVSCSDMVVESVWRNTAPGGTVVWSAARPGQGGVGHINCQPPEYWRNKAVQQGFIPDDYLENDLHAWITSGYHMGWFAWNRQLWYRPSR